jgi:hypothetical protein
MPAQEIRIQIRKCGRRTKGGVYAIGGGEGDPNGSLLQFTRLHPPIPYQVPLHRNARIVDAIKVLSREPMEEWWLGTSQETEIKKSGDAWAQDVFGMTGGKRLTVGECAGAKSLDDALAIIVSKVSFSPSIGQYFRSLSLSNVQEITRVTPHFEQLVDSLKTYTSTHTVGSLVEIQAALWRIAYNLPPSKRNKFLPDIMRILVVMNLGMDAVAMRKIFIGGK